MSGEKNKTENTGIKGTFEEIANEIKTASTALLSNAKQAIQTVAPALWKMIKLKVIGDATAMLIVAVVSVGVVFWLWSGEKVVISIVLVIASFPVASAIKRIIASDFFSLLEVLELGKKGKK